MIRTRALGAWTLSIAAFVACAKPPEPVPPAPPLSVRAPPPAPPSDAGAEAEASAPPEPERFSAGPRDPETMVGLTRTVQTANRDVVLALNVAALRGHVVGARLGPLLEWEWQHFLHEPQLALDPLRDSDWSLLYGPSLIHTDKDVVLVGTHAPLSAIDAMLTSVSRRYHKGGPFPTGVTEVKGWLGHADNAERVFLVPAPGLVAITPPSGAREAAVTLHRQSPRGLPPREAMRLVLHDPEKHLFLPGFRFPASIRVLDLSVTLRPDGGADLDAIGDSTDAAQAAAEIEAYLRRQNGSIMVRLATKGLLTSASVVAEGDAIKLHVPARRDQLEALMQLAAASVGVTLSPP